jgi:glycine reductase
MKLAGKKVIVLGERDGVQGTALSECVRAAGGEVVLNVNQCFV